MSQKLPLIELLYEAFNSELGIVVETSDLSLLRQKLYAMRKEDEAFQCLSLVQSRTHPNSQLWIVKRPEKPNE